MSKGEIDESSAPLVEHLIELRQRLMWAFGAILLAFLVCFYFATDIFNILVGPYEQAAGENRDIKLIYTAPQEFFFTKLKLALFGALFCAFPVIASQLYMFMAPGLYRNERQAFLPYLFATPILFGIGASLVYFVVMPLAMGFFISMEQIGEGQAQIELLASTREYLGLIMILIFAFGLVFQLPVVLTLLGRAGLISSDTLKTKRKWAIVITFIVAAILTPPDPITQIGLAVPTILLYEISIHAVRIVEKKRQTTEEAVA